MDESLRVDVWLDVVCPWCYIGKRRFEAGVAAFRAETAAPPVAVTHHSFELMPDTPVEFEGSAVDQLVRAKGLPAAQVHQMHREVAGIAAEVGLDYDFASLQPTNTRKAHQVLHLARDRGVQSPVTERLLHAHFVEGRHVGRDEELARLAAEEGLDADEVRGALADQRYEPAVDADIAEARHLGIRGVPFFLLDGRYGISGAQPAEAFTRALRRAWTDRPGDPEADRVGMLTRQQRHDGGVRHT